MRLSVFPLIRLYVNLLCVTCNAQNSKTNICFKVSGIYMENFYQQSRKTTYMPKSNMYGQNRPHILVVNITSHVFQKLLMDAIDPTRKQKLSAQKRAEKLLAR